MQGTPLLLAGHQQFRPAPLETSGQFVSLEDGPCGPGDIGQDQPLGAGEVSSSRPLGHHQLGHHQVRPDRDWHDLAPGSGGVAVAGSRNVGDQGPN